MDHRFHDGTSSTTVMVVRDLIPKDLQLFLSVLRRTSTTDRHTLDGTSCTTIMMVIYPSPKGLHTLSKCPTTNIDDGTSLSQRSVLLAHHHYQRLSFRGLHINIVEVRHDGPHDDLSYSRRVVTWSVVFHCYYRDVITGLLLYLFCVVFACLVCSF